LWQALARTDRTGQIILLAGMQCAFSTCSPAPAPCAPLRARSGTRLSLDNALPADIKCDVHEWDYTVYKPGHFDVRGVE
jgi:hypothetical protein